MNILIYLLKKFLILLYFVICIPISLFVFWLSITTMFGWIAIGVLVFWCIDLVLAEFRKSGYRIL